MNRSQSHSQFRPPRTRLHHFHSHHSSTSLFEHFPYNFTFRSIVSLSVCPPYTRTQPFVAKHEKLPTYHLIPVSVVVYEFLRNIFFALHWNSIWHARRIANRTSSFKRQISIYVTQTRLRNRRRHLLRAELIANATTVPDERKKAKEFNSE